MAVSAISVAKHMGQKSNWSLTNLEMQKILYLAHMFHLGIHDKPLVIGHFEAWNYGPVHPILYHVIKIFGIDPVENIFRRNADLQAGSEQQMTDMIMAQGLSATRLVGITHWQKGAWYKNYKPKQRGNMISDKDILSEYQKRIEHSQMQN